MSMTPREQAELKPCNKHGITVEDFTPIYGKDADGGDLRLGWKCPLCFPDRTDLGDEAGPKMADIADSFIRQHQRPS